jgi:hypothetical protein
MKNIRLKANKKIRIFLIQIKYFKILEINHKKIKRKFNKIHSNVIK